MARKSEKLPETSLWLGSEHAVQFFSIDRIQRCSAHLSQFPGNWIIPAFVFASNGVSEQNAVVLSQQLGTDVFLDRFFSGSLIGLPAARGSNALRPRFSDVKVQGADYAAYQHTKLWANLYSSRGYREMAAKNQIAIEDRAIRLTPLFRPAFEAAVGESFRFEELLVWLFAFAGMPGEVSDWESLLSVFHTANTGLQSGFPEEYRGRFRLSGDVPWPSDIETVRPSNQEFQQALLPSRLGFERSISLLTTEDPIAAEVASAVENGARNFLFYGPPGTGKTLYAREIAMLLNDSDEAIEFIQFHPSLSYDDFVEGYAPSVLDTGTIRYEVQPRIMLEAIQAAHENPTSLQIVVIDELSRGDAARIFGDLLTYIDVAYRNQEFRLGYSGKIISVPDNLIVIATANLRDRSVTDLDDAFLRRFHAIEFASSEEALQQHLSLNGDSEEFVRRLVEFLKRLNTAIPHGFGHAYLFNAHTNDEVRQRWRSSLRLVCERALSMNEGAFGDLERSLDELFPTQAADQSQNPRRA